MKYLITLLILSLQLHVFAHSDRSEEPILYEFTFEDNTVFKISKLNDSILQSFENKNFKEVCISFETGEKLNLKRNGNKWVEIKIFNSKQEFIVPIEIIQKIRKINIANIALLWYSDKTTAFNSTYFYIKFDSQWLTNSIIWRKKTKKWENQ